MHLSDADYRISWRFMTDPSLLASLASSSTCVPSRFGSSPPTSPMTILDDEIEDNLEKADTGYYTDDDILIIETNYDPQKNISFDPGRKGSEEDDFAYAKRILPTRNVNGKERKAPLFQRISMTWQKR